MAPVYLDHNATTPLDPRVRAAMVPWLGERFGNPSSLHRRGREARAAVDGARAQVARLLGARPEEIVFAASGTEANNTVVTAAGLRARSSGHLSGRLVISALEHPSIRASAERLATQGLALVTVPPEPGGVVDAERFTAQLTPDTRLACLMLASNEVGTIQPVAEVARACRRRGVPFLTDAVQAVGKVPVDAPGLGADYLVLGAHKFHGPLGAAALWLRDGAELDPLLAGGGQERRLRAGTENVAALVGLAEACRLAAEELPEREGRLAGLRDRLEAAVADRIPDARLHCAGSPRLPQTSHLAFPGAEGEALLLRLDAAGFAVSTGSACSSGRPEPSKALLAMGIGQDEALCSIRVSLGTSTSAQELDAFVAALEREVAALRSVMGVSARA